MQSLITLVERASIAAGIDSIRKGYPDNPRQRGATKWAAFFGAVRSECAAVDEVTVDLQAQVAKRDLEIAMLNKKLLRTTAIKNVAAANSFCAEIPEISSHQRSNLIESLS